MATVTITDTATGLSKLATTYGFSTRQTGKRTEYFTTDNIVVSSTGVLDYNADNEFITINVPSGVAFACFGTLKASSQVSGSPIYLNALNAFATVGDNSLCTVRFENGATINLNGVRIDAVSGNNLGGLRVVTGSEIIWNNIQIYSSRRTRFFDESNPVIQPQIDGLIYFTAIAISGITTPVKNLVAYAGGLTPVACNGLSFEGFAPLSPVSPFSNWNNSYLKLTNSKNSISYLLRAGTPFQASITTICEKRLKSLITDSNQQLVSNDAYLFVKDYDNGERRATPSTPIDALVTQIHHFPIVNGEIGDQLIPFRFGTGDETNLSANSNMFNDNRTASNANLETSKADKDVRIVSYRYDDIFIPLLDFNGLGDLLIERTAVLDSKIIESNTSIVSAFVGDLEASQIYEYFKLHRATNYPTYVYDLLFEEKICSRDGSNLDFGSFDILIDGTKTTAPTFERRTLTAQQIADGLSEYLVTLANVDGSIVTTGFVDLVNGGNVTEGYTDSTGTSLVVNNNAQGGSICLLNTTKYSNNLGYYIDEATAQTANPSPNTGDYYRFEDDTKHFYYNGTQWVEVAGRDIHEGYIASTLIGGAGISTTQTARVIDGDNYRVCVDVFGKYMGLYDVTINGLTSISAILSDNPRIDITRVSDALPYVMEMQIGVPSHTGLITLKMPQFNKSVGDESDTALAGAVVELARLGEGSLAGALATNYAQLAEITDDGVLTIKNDTLQIVPLDGKTEADKITVPLVLNAENYTIDPTPLNATGGRVYFEKVLKTVINTGKIVDARLDAISGISSTVNQLDLKVFVNTEAVSNGTGTQANPFDNFDDAKNLADTINASTIVIEGDAIITQNLKNYVIVGGSSRASIDLNNQDVDGSKFEHITIKGTASEPSNPKGFKGYDCLLDNVTGINGDFRNCPIVGNLVPADNAILNLYSCKSGVAGLGRPFINLTGLTDIKLAVRDWTGGLTLQGSQNANNETTISSNEIKLTLENTNTLGVISVRGQGQLTNQATCTVDSTAFIQADIQKALISATNANNPPS